MSSHASTAIGKQLFSEVGSLQPRDDPNTRRRRQRGRIDRSQIQHDGPLAAHDAVAAALEERERLAVALADRPLELVLPDGTGVCADVSEHRRANPASAGVGDDDELGVRMVGRPGVVEPGADRFALEPRNEVREVALPLEIAAQVLDARRRPVAVRRRANGDVGREVGFALGADQFEAGGDMCSIYVSSP